MDDEDEINYKNLPIFKKGIEILDVVRQICDVFPEEDRHLQMLKEQMIFDARQLTVKIAGATAGGLYDIKMEAATIIRKSAMSLKIMNHSLKDHGFKEVEYYNIVRDLIEEYRLLFIDWVAGFDKWHYIIDRWGLFNPPGVGPFDIDPDDDLPGWDLSDGDED